jgi:hypothetical protein
MTTIDEIADGIYRIFSPVEISGAGGFSFNQYLLVDDEPLLFHTGLRRLFPAVRDAIARVLPVEQLRFFAFAFRGRRVRCAERVPRAGAAGGAAVRPDRRDGLGWRLRRSSAAGSR